jgi:outer membrane lipoprotein-sorting protein
VTPSVCSGSLTLGALLVLLAAPVWAACDSTDACLQAIEASQRATRALSAQFEQTKHLSLLAEPLTTHGRFAFKAPDQILWQIEEPALSVRIDRDGVHLPDLPQAQAEIAAMAPFSAMLREISGVFVGSLNSVHNTFEVTARGDDAAIHVQLTPRSAQWQRMFRSLDLTFAMPDLVMNTIRIEETLGDRLEIVFSDIHRNDAIAEAALGPHQ